VKMESTALFWLGCVLRPCACVYMFHLTGSCLCVCVCVYVFVCVCLRVAFMCVRGLSSSPILVRTLPFW